MLLIILSLCVPEIVIPSYQNHNMEESENISSHRINTTTYQVWYYLPSYPNYSPSGLPDFDQRQNSTWKRGFIWSFCGPVALANIF
jgi:hypothetical protein